MRNADMDARMDEREKSVEIEARDLDDAIAEGLARLGLSREQAEIEVLEEPKRGLLGIGARKAKVRVSVKASRRSRRDDGGHRRRHSTADAGDRRPSRPVEKERELEEKETAAELKIDRSMVEEVILKLASALDEKVRVTKIEERSGRVECEIETDEPALLLGRRGRTLDAIQTLATALVARKAGDRIRVNLDIGGFRARRREVLHEMARDAAEDAIRQGEEIHLEPMSAHERKIIHSALAQNSEIATESMDSGDRRHVVVMPRGGRRSGGSRSGRSERGERRDSDRRRGRGSQRGGRDSRSRNDRHDRDESRSEAD